MYGVDVKEQKNIRRSAPFFVCRFLLMLIFAMIAGQGLAGTEARAYGEFCHPQELAGDLRPFIQSRAYRKTSQGMCVAEDCIIYTRFDNDWSETTYVILDLQTRKEIAHYDFRTGHSNSLAYNPYTRQLVAVSNRHAYIFRFENHVLTLQQDITMVRNCPKIAFVPSANAFYVATDDTVYMTNDFINLYRVFKVSKLAVDQGMGFDGTYLYIIWYRVGNNVISLYTPDGKYAGAYTLRSGVYREIEDVDFVDGKMLINIANSGEKDGIYYVNPSHTFGGWKVEQEPTCSEPGSQSRACTKCGMPDYEQIPATEKHKLGKWIVTNKATCTQAGDAIQKCSVCHQTQRSKIIKPLGHKFGEWTRIVEPTVLKKGMEERTCSVCGEKEEGEIPKIKATAQLNHRKIDMHFTDHDEKLEVEIQETDYVVQWSSDNERVAKVDENGKVDVGFPGKARITVVTAGGAKATCVVKVRLFPKFSAVKNYLVKKGKAIQKLFC